MHWVFESSEKQVKVSYVVEINLASQAWHCMYLSSSPTTQW